MLSYYGVGFDERIIVLTIEYTNIPNEIVANVIDNTLVK
jgi:hypothetical protein